MASGLPAPFPLRAPLLHAASPASDGVRAAKPPAENIRERNFLRPRVISIP